MSDRHLRAYRALLRCYPRRFRADYRDEMTRLFADQLRDARSTEGTVGVARLWWRSLVDLVVTAPGQHLEPEEVLVASPVGAPEQPSVRRVAVPRRVAILVGLIPLWLIVVLSVFAPGFMDPLYANPPGIAGLPAGMVLMGVAIAWMAVGVALIAVAHSVRVQLAAYLIFAVPAVMLILFGPATILIIQNLAV